jgi:hypothetical protein
MGAVIDLLGKAFGFAKRQFTMRFVFEVSDTPTDHNVSVEVWFFPASAKLSADAVTVEKIKKNYTEHFDVKGGTPRTFEWITNATDGYLYIVAEPQGVWGQKYLHRPEVREERIKTDKDNHFILALFPVDLNHPTQVINQWKPPSPNPPPTDNSKSPLKL